MLTSRPVLAATTMLILLFAGLLYQLRVDGIFACDGSKYGDHRFLAYCNAPSFADYDQGAFWFDLEEQAYERARSAQVLFVGNSKLQFALSTRETEQWFESRNLTHFLFGFAHNETVDFFVPVLERMQPTAKAVVIHVDRMFESRETPPMTIIRGDRSGARRTFRTRKLWQPIHRAVCGAFTGLCGRNFGLHRSRLNGHWLFSGNQGILDEPVPVSIGAPIESDRWPARAQRAEDFVSRLPVARQCILLMLVPSKDARLDEATAIASHLGIRLITPRLDRLTTFDRNHLDSPSAARWSAAFLSDVEDQLIACTASGGDKG